MTTSTDVDAQRAARARRAIAAAVTESWTTIPHFAVSREIAADALLARREQGRAEAPGLTVTDLLLQAAAHAGETDVVGLSVATERGVMNVSLAGIREATPAELAERRAALVARARGFALRRGDLDPAPVTLSNLGTHGVDWFTGIIPTGTELLLTTGAIRDAWTPDGGERRFWATANADHRAVDGADAARFLGRFDSGCRA
ncbi:2-oxo acid dehydrogenase subunit E2 [Conexibacter sp. CPCC 206217]|uniref:2-oxo acid dehydrogenase subunit E2 n=1 Tax=Conexibacter sp. CPCC 206217 TaxID=3064574 RepID=UPI00271BA6B2|nr:2-oxo acid dehydrogenase subunit E2 [Conexibacter sp. CPCC 206217]MDO8210327.1 2-oxo acid dehydrogenase subunit E2 [Conexibacter sp. CPCC 206217]